MVSDGVARFSDVVTVIVVSVATEKKNIFKYLFLIEELSGCLCLTIWLIISLVAMSYFYAASNQPVNCVQTRCHGPSPFNWIVTRQYFGMHLLKLL